MQASPPTRHRVPTRVPSRRPASPHPRPWIRAGVVAFAAHVGYELAAGVAVPLAGRIGPVAACALHGGGALAAYQAAARVPPGRGGRAFAVLDGFMAAAVLGHFTAWPRATRAGLPWLTECEGMSGRLMPAYNLILHASAVTALGGLREVGDSRRWALGTVAVVAPVMRWAQPREYESLRAQAARRPGWWNRRHARAQGSLRP